MQRIRPTTQPAAMLRDGQLMIHKECASELGIYATFLGYVMSFALDRHSSLMFIAAVMKWNNSDGKKTYVNKFIGHLLRTKLGTTDEGGVVAGFAVLDSPYLV
jgi:hypothetical protein